MRIQRAAKLDIGSPEWWKAVTRFEPDTGCLVFTGYVRPDGYRQVNYQGKHVLVHRLAYQLVYGPIPKGSVICHACDNPSCVNPLHLHVGTQKENLRDMFAKGRARPQGRVTPALTDFPAVSGRVNPTLSKSLSREEWLTRWHSTSSTNYEDGALMLYGWRRVTDTPSSGQTQASVPYRSSAKEATCSSTSSHRETQDRDAGALLQSSVGAA